MTENKHSMLATAEIARNAIKREKVRQRVSELAKRLAGVHDFERATLDELVENMNQLLEDHCLDIRVEIKEIQHEDVRAVCTH